MGAFGNLFLCYEEQVSTQLRHMGFFILKQQSTEIN